MILSANLHGAEQHQRPDGFIQALLEMYSETVNTLTDDKSVDEGNLAVWKVTKG